MKGKTLKEIAIFTKVVSAGFLVGGFALSGLLISRKLVQAGMPPWTSMVLVPAFTGIGAWHAWDSIKKIIKNNKRKE